MVGRASLRVSSAWASDGVVRIESAMYCGCACSWTGNAVRACTAWHGRDGVLQACCGGGVAALLQEGINESGGLLREVHGDRLVTAAHDDFHQAAEVL